MTTPYRILELNFKDGVDITSDLQKAIETNRHNRIVIRLPKGNYGIHSTIKLNSNTTIIGSNERRTKITLANNVNNNLFTNEDHNKGNSNLKIENLWLDGNASQQYKPEKEKRLSYCNLFYFKNVHNIQLLKIKATNCKQTAMHFNNSSCVVINKLNAVGMGWSGISTSGTDNIQATKINIYDAGNETRHSAVHFDGGIGSYFEGVVEKCTGNGIMLDSKYSPLNKSVIKAKCIDCKRGIAVFGKYNSVISNVMIQSSNVIRNEIGILLSNTENIFVSECNLKQNTQCGISLQGKFGNKRPTIVNSVFHENKRDIKEIVNKSSLYLIKNDVKMYSLSRKFSRKKCFNYFMSKVINTKRF